jgi:hypothetical protein
MWTQSIDGAAGQNCQKWQSGEGGEGDHYCEHLGQTIAIVVVAGGGTDDGVTTASIADT